MMAGSKEGEDPMRSPQSWDDEIDEESLRGDPRLKREPSSDPALAWAITNAERVLHGDVPNGDRAASSRARIVADARPLLARLARRLVIAPRWWEWTARWSRAAIPITAVAGVAAALLVVASHERTARVIRERTLEGQPAIVRAAVSDARTPEMLESLVGPMSAEWLISQVFDAAAMAKLREIQLRDSAVPHD
jgi:hypothetical protein